MSRHDFHQLLVRYLAGECNTEEEEWIDKWYQSLSKDLKHQEDAIDLDTLEKELWKRVHQETQGSLPLMKTLGKKTNFPKMWFIAAACSVVLLSAIWMIQKPSYPTDANLFSSSTKEDITTVRNETDSLKRVVLPDQSLIKLYPGAEVQYAATFLQKRDVHVSGDAYFDIKKSSDIPFIVFHQTTITKVLGTTFLIRNMPDQRAEEITVFSGKVEVTENNSRRNVFKRMLSKPAKVQISTNHRAVLNQVGGGLEARIAAEPLPLPSSLMHEKSLSFSAVSLADLARKLEMIYGVSIEVTPSLKGTTFTGDIGQMHLFEQLHLICEVTQTQYQIEGKRILIK